jgi:sulfur-carrier protein
VKVLIPSPLHSYTGGVSTVDVAGATLAEVLAGLDARFPGLRFRIVDEHDQVRRHIHFFVDAELVKRIDHPVAGREEIMIVCALSGG